MEKQEIPQVTGSRWYKKILLKKTNVDEEIGFDFYLSPLKWVGVIFAVSAVFLPFLLNIILRAIFSGPEISKTRLVILILIINLILVLIGMIYIIKVLTIRKFLESGAVGFYLYYYLPKINLLFMNIFVEYFLISGIIDMLVRLIVIILIFALSPTLRLKFKKTCKENLHLIFIVMAFGFIATIGLHFALCELDEFINGEGVPINHGYNEKSLLQASDIELVFAIFLLAFIAPFSEELACRHAIFSLSGNKCLGFFTSVIYFAGMHIESFGDWDRILFYMGMSIVWTLTFLYVRGNVTYTIFLHSLVNIVFVVWMLLRK